MVILFHTNNTLLATDLNENKGPSSTGSSPGQGPKSKVSQVAQPAQWRRPSCWEGDKEADKSKYTDKQEFHKQRNLQLAFKLHFKIIQRQKITLMARSYNLNVLAHHTTLLVFISPIVPTWPSFSIFMMWFFALQYICGEALVSQELLLVFACYAFWKFVFALFV